MTGSTKKTILVFGVAIATGLLWRFALADLISDEVAADLFVGVSVGLAVAAAMRFADRVWADD